MPQVHLVGIDLIILQALLRCPLHDNIVRAKEDLYILEKKKNHISMKI